MPDAATSVAYADAFPPELIAASLTIAFVGALVLPRRHDRLLLLGAAIAVAVFVGDLVAFRPVTHLSDPRVAMELPPRVQPMHPGVLSVLHAAYLAVWCVAVLAGDGVRRAAAGLGERLRRRLQALAR